MNDLWGRASKIPVEKYSGPEIVAPDYFPRCGKLPEKLVKMRITIDQRRLELNMQEPMINAITHKFWKRESRKLANLSDKDFARIGRYTMSIEILQEFKEEYNREKEQYFSEFICEFGSKIYVLVVCKNWDVVLWPNIAQI